jgi:hypothetical protein
MSKFSSFKKFQLITESFRKFLKEDEGGAYSIKHGSYGPKGFYGPDGEELVGPDGEYELATYDILAAVEEMPAFAQIIDKKAFEAHKQREREQGREEGPGLYPDGDMLERYAVGDLYGSGLWDALFKLYLVAAGVSNPQVGEYVAPDDDDDDYDY